MRQPVPSRQPRTQSDLLHGLKAVASGHRMTDLPKQTVPVPTRTQREPAAYRRNSCFLPRYRAVARSRRPHRNPCHRRVTNRPRSSPPLVCWGPASHRFRSNFQYIGPQEKRSVGHPIGPRYGGFSVGVSARPRLFAPRFRQDVGTLVTHRKAGVCARISIRRGHRHEHERRQEPPPTGDAPGGDTGSRETYVRPTAQQCIARLEGDHEP